MSWPKHGYDKESKGFTTRLTSEEDVERLLQHPDLEKLTLETPIPDIVFSALKELSDLKELNVISRYRPRLAQKNLGYLLSNIPGLESLSLETSPAENETILNISRVRGLKQLRINIGKTGETDLSPLGECVNLVELKLKSSGQRREPPNLSFLHSLSELERLVFVYTRPIDLGPLSSCHKLLELDLSNCDLLSVRLNSLSSCRHLKRLDLSFNHLTEIDLAPLSSCTELRELRLHANRIREMDLAPLSSGTELKILSLGRNPIGEIDLAPIQNASLENLYLGSARLRAIDLTPLALSYSLTHLALDENRLKKIDLSPLRWCKALRILHLEENQLTEINLSSLAGAPLEYLDLSQNPLEEVDLTQIPTTTMVNLPRKEHGDMPGDMRGVEKERGGIMWRPRVHPKSVECLRWPLACMSCGETEGHREHRFYSQMAEEYYKEGPGFPQNVLHVGVGNSIIGMLYITPEVFSHGPIYADELPSGYRLVQKSIPMEICSNCEKNKPPDTELVSLARRFDSKENQYIFTLTFANEKYAKLFAQENRCMKLKS